MDLEIIVFKDTGKYYASVVVHNEEDIPLFKDEFITFIRSCSPANIGEGFIFVRDVNDSQSFHLSLYRYNQIYGGI